MADFKQDHPEHSVRNLETQATMTLADRLDQIRRETLPLPGRGQTPERHRRLFAIARENLTLAKLAEAHWDALAILAEAGRTPEPGALYAVWASESPGQAVVLDNLRLSGTKPFSSGLTLVDRALLTAGPQLMDLELRANRARWEVDLSAWATDAFRETRTGAITFHQAELDERDLVGPPGFYLDRPGFWHGALGPAACWAGGVAGLLDHALASSRQDPHTLAHLGAMEANVWAMRACLERAGEEIDRAPHDRTAAHRRALTVRHLIEQLAADTLRRFARAYGPALRGGRPVSAPVPRRARPGSPGAAA